MSVEGAVALGALLFLAALLYSSVGHAGASGYLAAMALFGLAPEIMRPTALMLNILVATIATVKFYRAGAFSWRLFWPFAVASVPAAFVGGLLTLPVTWYRPAVGVVLLVAAYRFFRARGGDDARAVTPPPLPVALGAGALIGLLSGLTGVGGGIFLSPLVLVMGWAGARQAAGVSALFILVNSIAGLVGVLATVPALPTALPLWAALVMVGGWIGAGYGSQRLRSATLLRLLGVVLVIAGLKLVAGV